MSRRPLSEQLDLAVTAILAGETPAPDPWLADLVRTADLLRTLPNADFRERLKSDLLRRISMSVKTASPIREGFHTITPYLMVRETDQLIAFITQVFDAQEFDCNTGGAVRDFRIGDSVLMIGGARSAKPMPTTLHVFVPDADTTYRRALAAGATSLAEPSESHFGQRLAAVQDVSGNQWHIATHRGSRHVPDGLHVVTAYLHPVGANQFIDFAKRAFNAEEIEGYRSPEGMVLHAKIRIGDSVIQLGDARGSYESMPTIFYLYVDDVDAWYRRAVGAGATSLSLPADQPFGDRVGGVSDPFGNVWYIATHQSPG
jgi:PhnB protein